MNTIYLINSSKINKNYINDKNNDNLEYRIKKQGLSYEGKVMAIKCSKIKELQNVDYVYVGDYKSAIETGNIIFPNKNIIIDSNFNMRNIGVTKISQIPNYYNEQHFMDSNYKLDGGESQEEIRKRMYKGICNILDKYDNKKIAVISSSICIKYFLRIWCDIKYDGKFKYRDDIIFDGLFNGLNIFKMIFDNNKLTCISVIRYE